MDIEFEELGTTEVPEIPQKMEPKVVVMTAKLPAPTRVDSTGDTSKFKKMKGISSTDYVE